MRLCIPTPFALGIAAAVTLASVYYALGSRSNEVGVGVAALDAGHSEGTTPAGSDIGLSILESQAPDATRELVAVGDAVRALNGATAAIESAKVFEQDDRTLEQKYAGATLGQLLAAESLLTESRDRERERIGAELIANDRLMVVSPQVRNPSTDVTPPSRDGRPVSAVSTFGELDGVTVRKSAVISAEEYPDYRALELEVWWLHWKAKGLKKAQDGLRGSTK